MVEGFVMGLLVGLFLGVITAISALYLPGSIARASKAIEDAIHKKRANDFLKFDIDYGKVPDRNSYPPEEHIDPPDKWKT